MLKTYFTLFIFSFIFLIFSVYVVPFFFAPKKNTPFIYLPRPSGSRPIRNLFKIDFNRNFFFFSSYDIENFYFSFDPNFNLNSMISFNNPFSKINFYSPSRHFFFNYSVSDMYIFKIIKFSQNDFSNIVFSDNFSFISGSFNIFTDKIYFSLDKNDINKIAININCNFFFTFSINDFSMSLFLEYTDSYKKTIIPCSFISLSTSDYKLLLDLFKIHLSKNFFFNIDSIPPNDYMKFVKFVFSKFFSRIFSGTPLPVKINNFTVTFGYNTDDPSGKFLCPVQKLIYSNIDSFRSDDFFQIDYYTLNYILRNNYNKNYNLFNENFFKVKAFSFYKIKLI
jgi:hypothetical protein